MNSNTMKFLWSIAGVIGTIWLLIIAAYGYRDIPVHALKEKYGQFPSDYLSLDGMNIHFRDEGTKVDSTPLVLIHGTGSSLHTFDAWVEKLQSDRRVVRMDLPGYGLTGPFPNRDYSIEKYVGFLKDFLEAQNIEKCILGGNSLGGQISWRFALAYPEMIEKLILIDAAGYPYKAESSPIAFRLAKVPIVKSLFTFITPKSIAKASVENVYDDKSKVTDELALRYFELTLRPGNRQAFVDRFNAQSNPEVYKAISQIKCPTLILWGEKDRLIPPECAYRFQEDLPNDTLVIIKGSGHVPMEEDPIKSLEVLNAFLTKKS